MPVMIWTMFLLSTAYWGVSLGYLLSKVKLQGIEDRLRLWQNVMHAVVGINVRFIYISSMEIYLPGCTGLL